MAEPGEGFTGQIFISYRREETAYPAGWLYDRLAKQYGGGQVFKDVDSIELGDDFAKVITRAVASCDVLLAMIGERWLTITDEHGRRRLDDPDDFVRLEIEAALTRNIRVIPILVDGARMPRADELPHSLVSLRRRQALELSPSRFEYDTGRLLKVLDTTLAEVRTAHEEAAAISTSAAPRALHDAAEDDVRSAAEPVRGASPEDTSTTLRPAAPPIRMVPSEHNNTPSGHEGSRRWSSRAPGRSVALRRLLMICVPLAAVLAVYLIVRNSVNPPSVPQGSNAPSSPSNELVAEAPWRLVIRNDASSTGCTITLVNLDTRDTWSNPYAVHDTTSFVMAQGGNFRWSIESGCTVVSRPGPGNLTLPAVVDGAGTSDAFEPPAVLAVKVKDFHGNQRCALELRDAATGTVVDIGELDKEQASVTLQPQGRQLVYIFNDACAVQVSSG